LIVSAAAGTARDGDDSRASRGTGYYSKVLSSESEVVKVAMRLRSLFIMFALVVCCVVSARAQGEGQDLPRITQEEFKERLARNEIVVLDVRNGEVGAKIKGAAHIQEADLQARLKDLPRDREIITYCA
jgi:hypothetical protein